MSEIEAKATALHRLIEGFITIEHRGADPYIDERAHAAIVAAFREVREQALSEAAEVAKVQMRAYARAGKDREGWIRTSLAGSVDASRTIELAILALLPLKGTSHEK